MAKKYQKMGFIRNIMKTDNCFIKYHTKTENKMDGMNNIMKMGQYGQRNLELMEKTSVKKKKWGKTISTTMYLPLQGEV